MNDVNEILKTAIQTHQQGNLQKAEQLYSQVIQRNPENSTALHSLAIVAHQNNQNNIAVDFIERAIQSDPQNPQFQNTKGLIFEAIDKIDQAICSYQKAISLDPNYLDPHFNVAIALQSSGNFQQAVEKAKQIITLFAPSPQLYNLMGYSYQKQGELNQAIESYTKAISLAPDFAEPYNHIAVISNGQQQYAQAKENSEKAIELAPDYLEAYNNLGVALNGLNQFHQAMENFQKAIAFDPHYADAYYNLGNCLQKQNKCEQSIPVYQKAIQIDPNYAKAHWNLALSFLLTGNLKQGWQEYQWRRNPQVGIITYPHHYRQPYWDGTSFEGKRLLLHYEQGLGDNIQFARYIPMVKSLGGTVILEVQKPLFKLFQQIAGVDEFIQANSDGKAPDVNFDLHASTLDLPRIFGTTLENVPSKILYLYPEAPKVEYWRNKLNNDSFKVGLVWAGAVHHQNDHNRSCPLKHFAPLTQIEGLKLYALQKEVKSEQTIELIQKMQIQCLSHEFEDFTDTAAAIENMDLVISVDTSVLHLAGAMGKQAWALIPFAPDWRWMLDRQDTPWYPKMTLFRQTEPGNWEELFTRVAEKLQILVNKKYK